MTNLYDDLRSSPSDLPTPESAMTIGAHPDDAEFGAGGTLAKWAAGGCEVTMAILTDGSKGTWDPEIPTEDLIESRRSEQAKSGRQLGATRIVHGDHVDGELENSMELREEVCRLLRTYRPQVVLTHDPWRRYMLHPDHRAAGMAVIDGLVAARDHLFFPDQRLPKHRPAAVLLWQAAESDHVEDISGFFDRKIDALLCHSTQTITTMGDATRSPEARAAFETRMRELAREHGDASGIDLGEAFKLLTP